MKSILAALFCAALIALGFGGAAAQNYIRIPTCGTASPPVGGGAGYMDANGNICSGTSASSPSYTKPAPYSTLNSLAATSITSGTPQTVLAAGLSSAGGFIYAATTNTGLVCVNPKGTAGTSTSGDTSCFAAGAQFNIPPSTNAVSVNASTGTVTISGVGFQ